MKIAIITALVMFFSLLLNISEAPLASAKNDKIVLRMVTMLPDVPPGNAIPRSLQKLVSTYTSGEVEIKIIGGPEAIPPTDTTIAVKKGVIDVATNLVVFSESLVPGIDALSLSEYSASDLRKNGGFDYIRKAYEKAGLYFLSFGFPTEPQQLSAFFFRKEINTLQEFQGLKIASQGGTHEPFIKSLGATTISINFADFFTAMERGAVDGYFYAVPAPVDFGLIPVTKVFLDEVLVSPPNVTLVNLKKWDSLPQNLKDAINEATAEWEQKAEVIFNNIAKNARKSFSDNNIKICRLNHVDSDKFYNLYRNSMAADARKRAPEFVDELLKFLSNPDFSR